MPTQPHLWPNEPCPPWCIADHTTHVLPQDYLHEGAQVAAPAVLLRRHPDAEGHIRRQPFSATLDVVRYQYPGDAEQWVYIGGEDVVGLDMTVESARRVVETLSQVIGG